MLKLPQTYLLKNLIVKMIVFYFYIAETPGNKTKTKN